MQEWEAIIIKLTTKKVITDTVMDMITDTIMAIVMDTDMDMGTDIITITITIMVHQNKK